MQHKEFSVSVVLFGQNGSEKHVLRYSCELFLCSLHHIDCGTKPEGSTFHDMSIVQMVF